MLQSIVLLTELPRNPYEAFQLISVLPVESDALLDQLLHLFWWKMYFLRL